MTIIYVARLMRTVLLAQGGRRGSRRSFRVPGELNWQSPDIEPRWLGMETSDCTVAVQPSIFHNNGADERNRLLTGARIRQETALAIVVIGGAIGPSPRTDVEPMMTDTGSSALDAMLLAGMSTSGPTTNDQA